MGIRLGNCTGSGLLITDLFNGRSLGQGNPGPDTVPPRGSGFEAGGQD